MEAAKVALGRGGGAHCRGGDAGAPAVPERARTRGISAARMVVDAALALVFATLMATAVVEEVGHEWLGVAAFALAIVHNVLNRRWWGSLTRGRWSAPRVLRTVSIALLLLALTAQLASATVLSEHVLAWAPVFPGMEWARLMHLACAQWVFVLAAFHGGLHLPRAFGRLRRHRPWLSAACVAFLAISAAAGAFFFATSDMGAYLTLSVQFAAIDYETPLFIVAGRYLCIGALFAALGAGASWAAGRASRGK